MQASGVMGKTPWLGLGTVFQDWWKVVATYEKL
jgi:hypothetical protein